MWLWPRLSTPRSAPLGPGLRRGFALRGERHLVARLRAGDEVAFEVLYDRYAQPLLSFCRHMLGRPEEAEDAVQQVFASAHPTCSATAASWSSSRGSTPSPATAACRCCAPGASSPTPTWSPHRRPPGEVQTRADLRQLVADLGDLPENQRAALLLTELEDLSHAEAATVLDCEPSQVKGLVFRAREGLIERRDARSAPCEEIRAELSTARRGALRRGRLRHHLAQCEGCTAYLEDVRRQRRMMALILPVIPATGLKRSVLAAAGIGGGAGGAGGLTVAGGSALTGTVAKIATVDRAGGRRRRGHQGGRGPRTRRARGGQPARGPARARRPVSHRRPRRPPPRRPARHRPARPEARRGRGPAQARRAARPATARSQGKSRATAARPSGPGPQAVRGPGPDGARQAGGAAGSAQEAADAGAARQAPAGTPRAKPKAVPKPAKPGEAGQALAGPRALDRPVVQRVAVPAVAVVGRGLVGALQERRAAVGVRVGRVAHRLVAAAGTGRTSVE